jgi:hypothetical protein
MTVATLPEYQCHKKVRAAKIIALEYKSDAANMDNYYLLTFSDSTMRVSAAWANQFGPSVGGYYVVDNGRACFMSADAFDSEYTKV